MFVCSTTDCWLTQGQLLLLRCPERPVCLFQPGISSSHLYHLRGLGTGGEVFAGGCEWFYALQSYKIAITSERNCYLMRHQSATRAVSRVVMHFVQYIPASALPSQNKILVEDPTGGTNLPCNVWTIVNPTAAIFKVRGMWTTESAWRQTADQSCDCGAVVSRTGHSNSKSVFFDY